MRALIQLYQYVNILSLDIVAGSVISALFFAKIFRVQVKPYGLIALGLTVWIIYTVDHLRDAKRIKHHASTTRHRFHQKYFHPLIFVLCVVIVMDAIAIFFIRRQVFEWGLLLSSVVIVYLIIQQSLRFLKEFFIALLYTCGVLLLSMSVATVEFSVIHYLLVLEFGFIAWINLVLFSWFDRFYDLRDQQNSFVTIVGKRTTCFFLYGMFSFNFLLTIFQFILQEAVAPSVILLMMNATLFLIFFFRNHFEKNDLYRLIGDAVFLFPAIFLV